MKQTIRLNENHFNRLVKKCVKRILKESDDFISHGYKTDSNWGGKEIQINNSGDMARIRGNYGGKPDIPSEWLEIQFDEEGVAYVETPNGRIERLDMYMRY